jgi:hypothetical protein
MRVRRLVALREKQHLIVHLDSFDWDFTLGGLVDVSSAGVTIRARQVGSGNHEGLAVVELVPVQPWDQAEGTMRRILDSKQVIAIHPVTT